MSDPDPAVADWIAAINEVMRRGTNTGAFRPRDNRNPFEMARDEALEDRAEARADYRNYDYEGMADDAADRYERHLERGQE